MKLFISVFHPVFTSDEKREFLTLKKNPEKSGFFLLFQVRLKSHLDTCIPGSSKTPVGDVPDTTFISINAPLAIQFIVIII